jgi:hypothetical protein
MGYSGGGMNPPPASYEMGSRTYEKKEEKDSLDAEVRKFRY